MRGEGIEMRYQLTPIYTRPWLLNGLSLRLIESHYENHYGGALRRLNAITEQLESIDFEKTPAYVVNSLKREELIALNSTLLHELYFASMAFGDGRPTEVLTQALTRDFGSVDRWRSEFVAMAKGLAGGSGWVLLVYVPRDRRLVNQYSGDHGQATAGGIPILALDMYEHAYHIDFGANARAYIDTFQRNIDWRRPRCAMRMRQGSRRPGPSSRRSSEICRVSGSRRSKLCWTPGSRSRSSMLVRGPISPASRTSWMVRSGAIPSASKTGWGNCRNQTRSWCFAPTDFTL